MSELAGRIGERSAFRAEALAAARSYVERSFAEAGLQPRLQHFQVEGRGFANVLAEVRGAGRGGRLLVVGAHYDTVRGTPGADDNASGVATVVELARLALRRRPLLDVVFAAFPLEEPPFFGSDAMGSRVYARSLARSPASVAGMLSLEMVGYYRDEPGSQELPFAWMRRLYPDRGNFIAVAGNLRSRGLVSRVARGLRRAGRLPVESVALPFVPGVDLSDNWSFWQEGYPAAMVTDTSFFRNPHYHRASDLPETLDYRTMALLASALADTLAGLDLPAAPRAGARDPRS